MKHAVAAALASVLLVGWGCKGPGEPVARLAVPRVEVTLPHGSHLPFELRFEPSRALDVEVSRPLVFVHLLDEAGDVVRTFDHPLPGSWRPGEAIVDRFALYQSALAPALPAGDYRLTVGLYDGGQRRWALRTEGEEIARQEYAVARVRVPEIDPAAPRFAFSPEWNPAEPTQDRQTMARRWLSGDGSLEVQGAPVPAAVWLTFRIPANEPPLRLVLEEGASDPAVRVDTDCSGFAATLSGSGFHELVVPVATAPCRIRFDSNFVALGREAGRKLTVSLELLALQAGTVAATPAGDTTAATPLPPDAEPAVTPAEGVDATAGAPPVPSPPPSGR
jgi:hypothetical protein